MSERTVIFFLVLSAFAAAQARPPQPEAKMSFIDNGTIRLGIDLNRGGAITWLSKSGSELNVINSSDLGREVQMSYYSGPVPFFVGEKKPAPQWMHIGWNPIQAGDDFGHVPKILDSKNDGRSLYVKCVPMQWPLDDVPGECAFESWLELDGATVRARCRLANARADHTQFSARWQEMPAVYTNAPFYKIMTYSGDKPFTGGALTHVENVGPENGWSKFVTTENWSALVNDDGWGLGVWNRDCIECSGGFAGKPGVGGAADGPCGYLAPRRLEIIDHNIVHEYRYELILGSLEEIRRHVYGRAKSPAAPEWRFERDRQGWHFNGATDTGWPIQGELNVPLENGHAELVSPTFFTRAEDSPVLRIRAAFKTEQREARVFWRSFGDAEIAGKNTLTFPITGDGELREYTVRLSDSPNWRGAITQLRIDPVPQTSPGASVRVQSVALGK